MTYHPHLKILAFVGLTGSGKTTAVSYFTEKGYPKVYFGGMAYDIMKERGIEIGEHNEKTFRVDIRKELGEDVYAKRAIDQTEHLVGAGQHRIVYDGIYTWDEFKTLKHQYPGELIVVAVVGPKQLRYARLENRHDDRPQDTKTSSERDYTEIETIGKAGPIAAADYFVVNDGSLEDLYKQFDAIARETGFYEN